MATAAFAFEGFPGRTLRAALFTDVANGGELRDKIVAGALQPEAAFVNAAMVPSAFVLHLGAHKALAAAAAGRPTTRTLHSDLVFNLSPTNNITESLKRFGVSAEARVLLVARFDGSEEELEAACAHVTGTRQPLALLESLLDADALSKIVKPTPEELACGTLTDALVCRIAAKEVA